MGNPQGVYHDVDHSCDGCDSIRSCTDGYNSQKIENCQIRQENDIMWANGLFADLNNKASQNYFSHRALHILVEVKEHPQRRFHFSRTDPCK